MNNWNANIFFNLENIFFEETSKLSINIKRKPTINPFHISLKKEGTICIKP